MPTLEEFFEEAIEQADPENMVENKYKYVLLWLWLYFDLSYVWIVKENKLLSALLAQGCTDVQSPCLNSMTWEMPQIFLCAVLDARLFPSKPGFSSRAVNNSNYGWRALRLLARRSPHFFQPTNQQFKSLPEYLENMVIKLAKELPVSTTACGRSCCLHLTSCSVSADRFVVGEGRAKKL